MPVRPMELGALNPFHKIPAMTHGDLTLFESIAILRYLERSFGGAKLWPDEPAAAATVDQWASAVSDSLVNAALRYMAHRFGFLPVPEVMAEQFLEKTREFLPHFDRQLGKNRVLFSRHAGDQGPPRCRAQLQALDGRDGEPAERQSDGARAKTEGGRMTHTATWNGKVIAKSDKTLEVGGYVYFPRDAVRMELLESTPKTENDLKCPHGVQFYDVAEGGTTASAPRGPTRRRRKR